DWTGHRKARCPVFFCQRHGTSSMKSRFVISCLPAKRARQVSPRENPMATRREFIDALAVTTAGLALSPTARSYARIVGANDRLNFAVIGLNGRAYAHLSSLKANAKAARITHVCDVDATILNKFAEATQKETGEAAKSEKDFRKILEVKDVDAITIATPDHWHTPMATPGPQAAKPVYVENPCSHNPAEGAMLVAAQ